MHASSELFSKKLPNDYLGLERTVTRNAGTVIKDPHALLLLRFIADRTFGWSKDAEFITPTQFLHGIVTRAGQWVCAGLPFGKTTLYAALKILKAAGAIAVETVRGRARYSIPLEFVMGMKERKADRKPAEQPDVWNQHDSGDDFGIAQAEEPVRLANYRVREAVRQTNGKETHSPIGVEQEKRGEADASLSAAPGTSADLSRAEERLSAVIEARRAVQQPKDDARADRREKVNAHLLFQKFASAAGETFPNMTPMETPTIVLYARLKRAAVHWDHPGVSFSDFLEWCAQNWRGVYASKLRWVPNLEFTDHPDLEMFLRYRKAFRDSYDRRDSQRIRAGLTRRDNLIREHMFKGFSHEDASAEADEILAKERVREDLDARARQVNEAARRLEAQKQTPEYRLAVARIRSGKDVEPSTVKPVAPTKHPLKPAFTHANDEGVAPLPAFPEWKDDPDA